MGDVIKKYGEKGNLIYHCHGCYEVCCEYDEDGNEIYYKDSYGYEWWREYDENGKQTHFRNSTVSASITQKHIVATILPVFFILLHLY